MSRRIVDLSQPSWGIDIGDNSLKCIKLSFNEGKFIVLERGEYEYPHSCEGVSLRYHTQSFARELVSDAVAIMMNRHKFLPKEPIVLGLNNTNVVQRQFDLPSMDFEKLVACVDFEIRQQIPFSIDQVFFSWQQINCRSSIQEDILLIAAKKDLVEERLQVIQSLEITDIQPNSVALFNSLYCDTINSNAAEIVVVISVGYNSTDLIVVELDKELSRPLYTRIIPLGGSHWTRQISKDLGITFSKAEFLKRNSVEVVTGATNDVVTADMLCEIQRTLSFFLKVNKNKTTINRLLCVGSAITKEVFGAFDSIRIPTQMWQPSFCQPNEVVAFGLALQGLGCAKLKVGLIPVIPVKEPLKISNWRQWIPRLQMPFVFDRV